MSKIVVIIVTALMLDYVVLVDVLHQICNKLNKKVLTIYVDYGIIFE